MKFLEVSKDGGPESTVWAHWVIELKWLFSIVLLRFEHGTRDAYHSHAFNSVSWVLSGELEEDSKFDSTRNALPCTRYHVRSLKPVLTYRSTHHKVKSFGTTWVLSFRGPWSKTWVETLPDGSSKTMTHGRKEVEPTSVDPRDAAYGPGWEDITPP